MAIHLLVARGPSLIWRYAHFQVRAVFTTKTHPCLVRGKQSLCDNLFIHPVHVHLGILVK